mmetsp:Transcript_23282/g.45201  ORF Transcript_23282/g.45201 Transcript_23282/m.45201 type:complete len:205 (-) Transcript_23282:850-1464(-)
MQALGLFIDLLLDAHGALEQDLDLAQHLLQLLQVLLLDGAHGVEQLPHLHVLLAELVLLELPRKRQAVDRLLVLALRAVQLGEGHLHRRLAPVGLVALPLPGFAQRLGLVEHREGRLEPSEACFAEPHALEDAAVEVLRVGVLACELCVDAVGCLEMLQCLHYQLLTQVCRCEVKVGSDELRMRITQVHPHTGPVLDPRTHKLL